MHEALCTQQVSLNNAYYRRELVQKKQWPPNSPHLNPLQISFLWSDARSLFASFIRSQLQFLNKS